MNNDNKNKLILIADDDDIVRQTLSEFLNKMGYSTICASDGNEAFKLILSDDPDIVITDLQMPGIDGVQLLKKLRDKDISTPVIIATGYPDMDSAIKAVRNGAFDYFVKPFSLEMLYSRLESAMSISALEKENRALSELVSLHTIANELSGTRDLKDIMRVVLDFCSLELKANICSMVISGYGNTLSAEKVGSAITFSENSELISKNPHIAEVIKEGHLKTVPSLNKENRSESDKLVFAAIPIKGEDEIPGAVYLERTEGSAPFSDIELNTLDVLLSQAGSAAHNASLYSSLNQRLNELSLVSNYSEQFLGVIDLKEVIRRLFNTMKSHLSMDVMGFFSKKKRFHEFHYWSALQLTDDIVSDIISDTVDHYTEATEIDVKKKRISPYKMDIDEVDCEIDDGEIDVYKPAFKHVIPLVWDDYNFGALYFASFTEFSNPEDKKALLDSLVNQTRIALTNAKLYSQMKENYIRTIKALAIAVDAKDTYTHGHSENVMNIGEAIAKEMDLDEGVIGLIRDGGLLHDIGKIGIPGYILNKPGPLTDDEYNGVMKTHSTLGANIVRDVPFLSELHTLILHHHEHHDGNGYPSGLKGDEIPIGAQILHVADAFEAMTSDRPYRKSLGKKEAMKRLKAESGRQFSPPVIDAFFKMSEEKGWMDEED